MYLDLVLQRFTKDLSDTLEIVFKASPVIPDEYSCCSKRRGRRGSLFLHVPAMSQIPLEQIQMAQRAPQHG